LRASQTVPICARAGSEVIFFDLNVDLSGVAELHAKLPQKRSQGECDLGPSEVDAVARSRASRETDEVPDELPDRRRSCESSQRFRSKLEIGEK
jgi:hypothetical protein